MIETPKETKGEMRKKLLDEALRLYEETLKRTERKKVSIYTQHRILLDKALAEINSDDDDLIEKAKKVVQDITEKQGPASPANFDPNRADCAIYLYNLARWYELSLEQFAGVHKAKEKARRYLAYSVARSKSPLDKRYLKKHFSLLYEDKDLEILLEILDKKLCEEPKLAMMTGDIFKSEIDLVMKMVDQRLKRPVR